MAPSFKKENWAALCPTAPGTNCKKCKQGLANNTVSLQRTGEENKSQVVYWHPRCVAPFVASGILGGEGLRALRGAPALNPVQLASVQADLDGVVAETERLKAEKMIAPKPDPAAAAAANILASPPAAKKPRLGFSPLPSHSAGERRLATRPAPPSPSHERRKEEAENERHLLMRRGDVLKQEERLKILEMITAGTIDKDHFIVKSAFQAE